MSGFFNSSIGRKVTMALSAFFLMIFLLMHLTTNLLSVISPDTFNQASHFMGTNPAVQFLLQPILILGVVYHFVMGFILEARNRASRSTAYVQNKGGANSAWVSRNMIYSGLVILAFLVLHFIDFWIPEINTKYIQGDMSGMLSNGESFRYWEELHHKFASPVRTLAYVAAFFFLMLHLLHGFSSAFQSVGANNKYTRGLNGFGKGFAIVVPLGFIIIALFHHFTH